MSDCTCTCHPNGDHGQQYCEECCNGVRPRCKTCKHWDLAAYRRAFGDSQQHGFCYGADGMLVLVHGRATVRAATREYFGCVQHEERE